MLFVQSLRGLSHTKLEDTKPEHLELAVAGARPPCDEDDPLGRRSRLARPRRGAVAALALGAGVTWNISNVGAVADPLADAYGTSLAAVGLLTTALFLTHLASQIPAGRASDRWGARRVGVAALLACMAGNGLALVAADPWLAGGARLLTGIGSGAGFVAGADYARATGGGPALQGLYGASTMAGGGLAIAITPQLVGTLGWRAPYWTGLAVALVTTAVLLAAPRDPRHGWARPGSSPTGGSSGWERSTGRRSASRSWPRTGSCRSSSATATRGRRPR